jgi:hypothetical protein
MHRLIGPRVVLAAALSLSGFAVCARGEAADFDARRLRPAMLVWDIGTNRPGGPSRHVEVVTRAAYQTKQVWRITHYPHDPVAAKTGEFDLYDVDGETLAPLRSVMRNPRFELALDFDGSQVQLRRTQGSDESLERFTAPAGVAAEGPGSTVFVGSLPLRVGYTLRYQMVDRWDGRNETRVKKMKLTVLERSPLSTQMGLQDTFKVLIAPEDGSFRIVERVRAQAPHYPLQVEYTRGDRTLASEVIAIAISTD